MPADDPEFDESLLSAYLDDELTANEREIVERELASSPAMQQLLVELSSVRELVKHLHAASPNRSFTNGPWNSAETANSSTTTPLDSSKDSATVQLPPSIQDSTVQWQRLASLAALLLVSLGIGGLLFSNFVRNSGATIGFSPGSQSTETQAERQIAPKVDNSLSRPSGSTDQLNEPPENAPVSGDTFRYVAPDETKDSASAPPTASPEASLDWKRRPSKSPSDDKREQLSLRGLPDPGKAKGASEQLGRTWDDPGNRSMVETKKLESGTQELGTELAMDMPSVAVQNQAIDQVLKHDAVTSLVLSEEFSLALSQLRADIEAKESTRALQVDSTQQPPQESLPTTASKRLYFFDSSYQPSLGDKQTWNVSPGDAPNSFEFRLSEREDDTQQNQSIQEDPELEIVLGKKQDKPLVRSDLNAKWLETGKPGEPAKNEDYFAQLEQRDGEPGGLATPSGNLQFDSVIDFLIPRNQWAKGSQLLQRIGIPVQSEPPTTPLDFIATPGRPSVTEIALAQAPKNEAAAGENTELQAIAGQGPPSSAGLQSTQSAKQQDDAADLIRIRIRVLPKK